MPRDRKVWIIGPLLCLWPIAANADNSDAAGLIAECGAADLPRASLDSCLERVRVREETDPSSQLQTLEANLEQRESGRPVAAQTPAPSVPRVVDVAPAPNAVARDDRERDQPSLQPQQADSSAPLSGAALEDEPPVSDAPDAPAGMDPAAEDETSDPPQL